MSKDNVLDLKNTVDTEVKDALTGLIRAAANKAIHEAIMVELKEGSSAFLVGMEFSNHKG